MARDWVVIGCGGHGREVAGVVRLLLQKQDGQLLGFLDDNQDRHNTTIAGLPVLGGLNWLEGSPAPLSIALGIGASVARKSIMDRLGSLPLKADFPPLIHPGAILGPRVEIGKGTLIQAGCILTCDIEVGSFVVLNVGASLSHDVRVGDYATLAPGARMAGAVQVGALAEIGMGTLAIQGRTLGEACTTGAGAVIVRDVMPNNIVVGVPARPIRTT